MLQKRDGTREREKDWGGRVIELRSFTCIEICIKTLRDSNASGDRERGRGFELFHYYWNLYQGIVGHCDPQVCTLGVRAQESTERERDRE